MVYKVQEVQMKYHEKSNIFPLMSKDEYEQLRDDIFSNGLLEPIILYEGDILDGRNRHMACLELGIEPKCYEYTGDDPESYVISKNLHRRHLSKEQRQEIMVLMRLGGSTYQEIADTTNVSYGAAYEAAKDVELIKTDKLKGRDGKYRPTSYESKRDEIPHVSRNTGNNEWYTPLDIILKARLVMDYIDLDPASSHQANRIVQAREYYTVEDNGLEQEWSGKVWLNPPYSQPEVALFCDKLVESYNTGEVSEAIVLVNNATETGFVQNMLKSCEAVCFIKSRVRFLDETGEPSGAPLQGQILIYFGGNGSRFVENFSDTGRILWNEAR
jgi:phage N-6-adenine-methyltransferase